MGLCTTAVVLITLAKMHTLLIMQTAVMVAGKGLTTFGLPITGGNDNLSKNAVTVGVQVQHLHIKDTTEQKEFEGNYGCPQ